MKKLKKNLPEGVKYEFARYKGVKVKLVPNKKKRNKTKYNHEINRDFLMLEFNFTWIIYE